MNDAPSSGKYLQQVLQLQPRDAAGEMVRMRQAFLSPSDVILAEETGETSDELRAGLLHRLHELRRDFWRLNEGELRRQLQSMRGVANPEIAVAAARLLQVTEQRPAIAQLRNDRQASATFVSALTEILTAPSTSGNQLRERQHGWMRPEQNPQHAAARQAIASTVHLIRANYPGIFALEETWLSELAAYDPRDEQVDEGSNTVFGLAVVIVGLLVLVAQVNLVKWMFS